MVDLTVAHWSSENEKLLAQQGKKSTCPRQPDSTFFKPFTFSNNSSHFFLGVEFQNNRILLCNINIGTLSVQELFFQLIRLLGVRLGVGPVGMVELFVHGASLTT